MGELLSRISLYLQNFANSVHPIDFVINLIVTTVLSMALTSFYVRFGNAVSNRRRFASNFAPLALTTMLVMIIVKSSLALSLGLVGALSIVRFRAAIKDPEELTYLFLIIGIGLCTGANQPFLAILIVTYMTLFLFLSKRISGAGVFKQDDGLYVNITTDITDLNLVIAILETHFSYVELKRMDALGKDIGLDLSFVCKVKSAKHINDAKNELMSMSVSTTLSVVDRPDIII